MKNKVIVSGIGILSSSGKNPDECWSSLIQKTCTATYDERIKNTGISICSPIIGFNPEKCLKKILFGVPILLYIMRSMPRVRQ
ncbi:MAG: hypothetical protein ACRDAJ_17090 [Serratia fonticola]